MRATLSVALLLSAAACNSKAPQALQCAADELLCGGACVKFLTSPANCGACNNACAASASCQSGSCVTPDAGSDAGMLGSVCVPSVQATAFNATTASISIDDFADGGCIATLSFNLTVAESFADGGFSSIDVRRAIGKQTQLTGLVAQKAYVFAATGVAADGFTESPLSPFTAPLTLVATPGPPTGITLLDTTSDSVILGFTAPTGQALPFTMLAEADQGAGFTARTVVAQDASVVQLQVDPSIVSGQARLRTQLSNGELSDPSNAVAFTLKGVPTAPGGLFADGGVHGVFLSWTAPADAGQADASVQSYEIDTSHDGTSWNATTYAAGGTTSAVVSFTIADAGTFSFRVSAINQFGSGPPSNVVTGRPLFPPAAPSGLVARPGTHQLGLHWKPGVDFTGAQTASYDLYVKDGGSAAVDQFLYSNDGGTTAIISGLINGATYTGGIFARNADGTSGAVVHFSPVTPLAWVEPVLSLGTQNKGAAFADGGVVVFGGLTGGVNVNPASIQSYTGALDFDGYVPTWKVGANLQRPIANMASIGVQTNAGFTAFALGGLGSDGGTALSNLFDVSEAQALANPVFLDGGSVGWTFQAPGPLPRARHDYGVASTASDVYLIGGIDTSGTAYNDIQHAAVSGGVLSGFTTLPITLPTPRYGVAAVAYNGYLYTIGGNQQLNGGPVVADVHFAPIQNDGTLGTTLAATLSLPGPRYLAGAAAWNGRLYVTSGTTDTSGSNGATALREVLVGTINPSDGTITSWTTNAALLPTNNGPYGYLRAPAAIENGYLSIYGWQYQALGHIDPITGTIGNNDGGSLPP